MRAAAFIKGTTLAAACISFANVQAVEYIGYRDLTLGEKVLDSRDWLVGYDRQSPIKTDRRDDERFVMALGDLNSPLTDTQVGLPFDEGTLRHSANSSGFIHSLIAFYTSQSYTEVLAIYSAELLAHWRAFLHDNHIGFTFTSRTWAIGGLVH